MTGATPAVAAPVLRMPVWLLGTITGLFGLFYAYAVWNAIGNLIASVQAAGDVGLSLNGLGWALWIVAILLPALVFALAFWIARREPAHHAILVMLTGLALVAVFWFNLTAYTALNTSSLLS